MFGRYVISGGRQGVYPQPTGPAPTGPYEYLSVPRVPAGTETIPPLKTIFFYIETFIGANGAYADRIDLINGTRIYRVEVPLLWRFPSDRDGPFLSTPKGVYRFTVNDPSVGIAKVNDWMPVGL